LKLYDTGEINVNDIIVIQNQKKEIKYGNHARQFYTNLHIKDVLGMEFTAC